MQRIDPEPICRRYDGRSQFGIHGAHMLIVPFFLILLALKLAATALVYQFGPIVAIPIVLALIGLAHIIDGKTPQQEHPRVGATGC
jgi:hypothetical protein